MLIISRTKLYMTRFLMWGGIAVAVVGAVIFYISSDSFGTASIVLLAAGLVISLLGAACMKRLFRCPNCKKTVLPNDSGIDFRTANCPDHCPHCGMKIQLEK